MDLGRIGLFSGHLNLMTARAANETVQAAADLGFGTVWLPESAGKEALTHAAVTLGGTTGIAVATCIANIWVRDPMAMANGARTLIDAYPDRFLLGVGIGHRPSVAMRGHDFSRPIATMRSYLQMMDSAPFRWNGPVGRVPRVIAALGPKMLELARDHADGSCPYLTMPVHTAGARKLLGPDAILAPELAVVVTTDAEKARRIAREHFANYLRLENYRNSLLRAGWTEADLADGGNDRLTDALVAWGEPAAIRDRVQEHLEAGASHVSIQILGPNHGYSAWSYASLEDEDMRRGGDEFPMDDMRRLATVLFR
ncbi:TIGR03620 family F420-dependent LLM class oxidoreductase [Paractinoplanes rhizophilus]|uniref:TIGR03620 family F420-dependent LLM class oxidoreductase n=1 Tax=Paractinoplanes rhizophilus TaxID=1416877 RepID=A0ABW2I0Q6_9ACTN